MSKDYIICGKLLVDGSYVELAYVLDTNELVALDDLTGNCIVGNVTLDDPVPVSNTMLDNIIEQGEALNCIGAAVSEDAVVLFLEGDVAAYYDTSLTSKIREVNYDLFEQYDGDIQF